MFSHIGIENGPNFYGGQQCGILCNQRKFDTAISQRWRSLILFKCKVVSISKIMTLNIKEVLVNFVPAAAGIQRGQALFIIIGWKKFVDGLIILLLKNYLKIIL